MYHSAIVPLSRSFGASGFDTVLSPNVGNHAALHPVPAPEAKQTWWQILKIFQVEFRVQIT